MAQAQKITSYSSFKMPQETCIESIPFSCPSVFLLTFLFQLKRLDNQIMFLFLEKTGSEMLFKVCLYHLKVPRLPHSSSKVLKNTSFLV